ncbi:MAG TPA: protein kinase [Thermoanaerobaculia bacterium]|nr:protein kinase [Thermoanaerobaculia bacterium]
MINAGSQLGPYEIVSPIGAGGMGEVWKARDTRLNRSVAIKVLPAELAGDAQLRLRFEREAKTISQLEHPHICRLYDVGESGPVSYLVMELLDGESLADRLARGPLPLNDALRIGAEVADALDRAHRAGVVHRDLKPGNIMITRSGAKLLDFGLAATVAPIGGNDATVQKPLTAEGTIVGTFQYMAPEQLNGTEADARSDIFALGAVLYEMATGRRAFDGKTKASVIASILDRDPAPISSLQPLTPPLFERVVATCLNKDPDARWQNAQDLRRQLEWIRDGVTAVAAEEPRKRRSIVWMTAAALAIAAAGAGGYFWSRATAPRPKRIVSAIAPPPEMRFVVTGDSAGPVTLSPDGRWAAFVAGTSGAYELWIQSLESGVNTRLPGTARAMFPFWSPDSRSLGFFADGRLMTIDIDGSAPREIANAPDGRGGAWTRSGQIIFSPQSQAGLFTVGATGGEPRQITTPKPPHTTHRWPAVLPDDGSVVYLAASHGNPNSPETGVMIANVDGSNPRRVMASTGNALPFRDHLLFTRGERLVAQQLKDGNLTGPVIPIWGRTLYDPGTWRSIFSVSSAGLLATYPATQMRGTRLVSIGRDGSQTDIAPPAIYRDIAVSPDGNKIAMTIGDPSSVLYVEDLKRRVRSRFTLHNSIGHPAWTPDGRFITFSALKSDGGVDLLIKPVDGSTPERILTIAPYPMQCTSFDVRRGLVLYNALNPEAGGSDVMAVPLAGGKPIIVVGGPGQQTSGAVSPDGRWLAFVEINPSGRAAFITTYPTPGPKWQVSDDAAYWIWWGGSSELRYLTGTGDVKSVALTFEDGGIQFSTPRLEFRVNVNTNRRGLASNPDGSRVVAAQIATENHGPATLVANFHTALP